MAGADRLQHRHVLTLCSQIRLAVMMNVLTNSATRLAIRKVLKRTGRLEWSRWLTVFCPLVCTPVVPTPRAVSTRGELAAVDTVDRVDPTA